MVVERRGHDRHEENGTHARRDPMRFVKIPETHRANESRCSRAIFIGSFPRHASRVERERLSLSRQCVCSYDVSRVSR